MGQTLTRASVATAALETAPWRSSAHHNGEVEALENNIQPDIKAIAAAVAKNYYAMLRRREQRPGVSGGPYECNDLGIRAVEQAWARMGDDVAREFVRRNLFEGERMQYIDLPMSISTMKRLRRRFLLYVSEELRGVRQE